MRCTGKRRKKRVLDEVAYRKATWYLSRGYPARYVATKVGKHYKTVEAWGRKQGSSNRVVYRLQARINRLAPHLREKLVARLTKGATT